MIARALSKFRLLRHRYGVSPHRPRHPLARVLLGLTGLLMVLVLLVPVVILATLVVMGSVIWKRGRRPVTLEATAVRPRTQRPLIPHLR